MKGLFQKKQYYVAYVLWLTLYFLNSAGLNMRIGVMASIMSTFCLVFIGAGYLVIQLFRREK